MNKFTALAIFISSLFTASANNNSQSNLLTTDNLLINENICRQPQSLVLKVEAQPEIDPEQMIAEKADRLTDFAASFLGRKYVFGANGPKYFDCSGFTSYVFRNEGVKLHRTSRQQWTQGDKVDRDELQAGDLMFFSSPRSGKGKVGHVGIVVDVDPETNAVTFIHASTSKGITYQSFPDNGYYSRNYIGAKRVLSADA